jgi:hypothetical protein
MGRPLPTADVGYPVAQLGSQLSGGEIARSTDAADPQESVAILWSTDRSTLIAAAKSARAIQRFTALPSIPT